MNFPSLVCWDRGHTLQLGHSHDWQEDLFRSHLVFPHFRIPLYTGIHMTFAFRLSPLPHLRLLTPGQAGFC